MKRASLRRTRTGYICIADHVLLWLRACSICDSPVCTAVKAMKAARSQGGDEQKVWLLLIGSGVRLDGGRYKFYGRVCKTCKEVDGSKPV